MTILLVCGLTCVAGFMSAVATRELDALLTNTMVEDVMPGCVNSVLAEPAELLQVLSQDRLSLAGCRRMGSVAGVTAGGLIGCSAGFSQLSAGRWGCYVISTIHAWGVSSCDAGQVLF